jgi:Tol biopolymer transport system component
VGNGYTWWASISDNGRFVSFSSSSSNLVPRDRNRAEDVFVRDLRRHRTRLVSVTDDERRANSDSSHTSISGDGRFVAFRSDAPNLAPGGAGYGSVYVRDRHKGTTEPIAVDSRERFGNSFAGFPDISRNGRFVAFTSFSTNLVRGDTNGRTDVFLRDRKRGITRRVNLTHDGSQSRGESIGTEVDPQVSADGRWVAFGARAGDLVPGDNGNSADVFVHDRRRATTRMVSVTSNGELAPGWSFGTAIPDNGSYVAFTTSSQLSPGDRDNDSEVCLHGLPPRR